VVGFEFEVLAKKYDRFGWDRDADTPEQNRLITDWMDALQDYPLDEVQAACREWVKSSPRKMPNEGDILSKIQEAREWVKSSPRKMPNEGDILSKIQEARRRAWQDRKAQMPPEPEKPKERVSADRAAEILADAGFSPKRFGGDA